MSSLDEILESLQKEYSSDNSIPFSSLPPNSSKKVLWECALEHQWDATLAYRIRKGTGCPYCSGRKLLVGFNDLATVKPELVKQWNAKNELSPSEVLAGGKVKYWWLCSQGHEWEAVMANRVRLNSGCPYCTGQRVLQGFNDLATLDPEVSAQWNSRNALTPQEVAVSSTHKVWWECSLGHEWEAVISDRTGKNKRGCPYCANKKVLVGYNDLATTHPHLLPEWSSKNDVTPQEITAGSKKPILWECSLGHEWEARAEKRKQGRGCPVCDGKKVQVGANDLATTHPELVLQWSDKNIISPQELTRGSNTKVWWVCSLGHEWEASPHVRAQVNGTGCPYCAGKNVLVGYNDLASNHPILAAQWHPDNLLQPTELVSGSKKLILWKCDHGHEWEATPDNRTRAESGCPHCARRISRVETELADFIKALFPEVEVRTTVRDVIGPKELDIYVPSKKIAIEFNGLYWHTEGQGKDKNYHRNKWLACHEQGIQLVQVWEDQWRDKKDVVKRMIAHKLGASQESRVFARKTKAVQVSKVEAAAFLEAYHIQGFASGSHYLALKSPEGEIVALMVLKKQGTEMLLARYATSCAVAGGQSKLVSYAEKRFSYDKMVTFADLEVSDGSLYEVTGFTKDKELDPDYRYLYGGERRHKFGFRLKRFREDSDLHFVEGMSERELALLNGIERVWDSGKIRYVKSHPASQK